ncbi:hypothetical protein HanIR_Chr17g0876961 [Helianthus annuus]|nr:hypothetical protein HanIR_Chr17g0876961 [Helianthus annuus]
MDVKHWFYKRMSKHLIKDKDGPAPLFTTMVQAIQLHYLIRWFQILSSHFWTI